MTEIEIEGDWVVSLAQAEKVRFLVSLGRELTVAGRESYTFQEKGLDHPEWLREINEIQHRVLACLHEVFDGKQNISFERSIADWVLGSSEPTVRMQGKGAWNMAKRRVIPVVGASDA